jgi:hypothetical protein
MLHVPLLSEAYEAALFPEDRPQPPSTRPEVEPRSCAIPRVNVPDQDEDLETAPTRPLRLDQIHL